ncbi:MAG TPA: hypothetical protein VD994_04235 [Prosthecobacter sp.]|nr:hypothetical protein [Prosthecobacter sp.]
MKSAISALTLVFLAVFGMFTWLTAQTPAPQPTGVLPPGPTSLTGSIGITVYNNEIYLVREGAASKIDTTTIPAGHMMTLDGRLEPLPPGVKLPGAQAPDADEAKPRPGTR